MLLEVAGGDRSTIDVRRFRSLVASFGPAPPTTLFSPDRYALRLEVRAPDTVSALSTAVTSWKRALRRCDLPDWQLVRAEIMTPAELEAELDQADADPAGSQGEAWARAPRREVDPVEEELLRRALFDSVTGLPSRALFLDELRRVLDVQPAAPTAHAVMAVRFAVPEGPVPDAACDEVLAQVARQLAATMRSGDLVARVGPTDLALLLEITSPADADRLAGSILDRISCLLLEGGGDPVAASAGIVLSGDGETPDHLLHNAQRAAGEAAEPAGRGYRRRVRDQFPRAGNGSENAL